MVGGEYYTISICCASALIYDIFQSYNLKGMSDLIHLYKKNIIEIRQFQFEIDNPRKLGPENLTFDVTKQAKFWRV